MAKQPAKSPSTPPRDAPSEPWCGPPLPTRRSRPNQSSPIRTQSASIFNAAMNASCGISTLPN